MANRYWVGGTGTWDETDTTNWSTGSGGSGGASVPTSSDNVFFDSNSNATAYSVTIADSISIYSANFSVEGPASGKVTFSIGTGTTLFHSGNFSLSGGTAGITWSVSGDFTTKATANCNFNTYGVTLTLTSVQQLTVVDFNLRSDLSCYSLFFQTGTFNSNDFNMTLAGFAYFNTMDVLSLGISTITIAGIDTAYTETGTITTSSTDRTSLIFTNTSNSEVIVEMSSNVTQKYHTIWFNRGASTGDIKLVTVGTLETFKIKDTGTKGHNFKFSDGQTYSTRFFSVKGNASELIIITTLAVTTAFNLTLLGGGKVGTNYLNIQHCIATPANYTWYAGANSTNNQGNSPAGSGWIFTAIPASKLPSFIQC